MNARNESLQDEFTRWLGRYSPRRALQQNEQAMEDEITALMRAVLKMAPHSDYLRWLERVTTALDFQMKTSAWPTVAEVGAACSNMNKQNALQNPKGRQPTTLDPVKVAAKRMNAGEPVGDQWLYGRLAVDLIASGHVDGETMRKYRSALYFSFKGVLGEEKARAREADWLKRHEDAESLSRDHGSMPEGEPFKRIPVSDVDQYAAE